MIKQYRNWLRDDTVVSYLFIMIIAISYLFNLQGGHNWGGDFSMYIMNALNLLHGEPYAQTGYIYNPDVAFYGPPAYPPVFPLMLTPFLMIWGLNLMVLKVPGMICLVGILLLFNYRVIPRHLPVLYRVLFLAAFGWNPYLFEILNTINSDLPFVLFCVISLVLLEQQNKAQNASKTLAIQYGISGIWMYLAYGTRSLGIVLLPVAFLYTLLKNRKKALLPLGFLILPVVLILLQGWIIPETGAYFDQLQGSLAETISLMIHSLLYYFLQFANLVKLENALLAGIVFAFMLEACIVGLITKVKKGLTSFDLFSLFYFGLLLLWPSYQGMRLLLPVIPFFFLYIVEGLHTMIDTIPVKRLQTLLPAVMILAVSLIYAMPWFQADRGLVSAMEKTETLALFDFIRHEAEAEDVVLFVKPRVLALYTGAKSVAMAIPAPANNTLQRMNELNISIVIHALHWEGEFQSELGSFIQSHPDNFLLLYENADFKVYRFLGHTTS